MQIKIEADGPNSHNLTKVEIDGVNMVNCVQDISFGIVDGKWQVTLKLVPEMLTFYGYKLTDIGPSLNVLVGVAVGDRQMKQVENNKK